MLIYCISTVSGVSMPMPSYNHTGWLGGKTPGDRFLFHQWEGLFLLKCWLVSACTTVSELAVFTKARLALMSLCKSWLGSTEERSFILSTGKSRRAVVHLVDRKNWRAVLQLVDRKYWRAVFSMKTGKSGRAVLHLVDRKYWRAVLLLFDWEVRKSSPSPSCTQEVDLGCCVYSPVCYPPACFCNEC